MSQTDTSTPTALRVAAWLEQTLATLPASEVVTEAPGPGLIMALAAERDALHARMEAAARIAEEYQCGNCGTWFHPSAANECCVRPSWERQRDPDEIAAAIRARAAGAGHG